MPALAPATGLDHAAGTCGIGGIASGAVKWAQAVNDATVAASTQIRARDGPKHEGMNSFLNNGLLSRSLTLAGWTGVANRQSLGKAVAA
jgi:D-arabinose 1-dehydrogenase-like Zn-dependent alcohol dehydrogenase